MNFRKIVFAALLLSISLWSCTEQDEPQAGANVRFEITDAPIDDASVKGAFVTIAEVRVDGEPLAGFSGRQTIDLLAYQNGNTRLLVDGQLESNAYAQLTLVLDYAQDADGNSPGCYVLRDDNSKVNLASGSEAKGEIRLSNSDFVVGESGRTNIVLDFDLRKAITRPAGEDNGYRFVSDAQLRPSIRLVPRDKAGMAKGQCQNAYTFADKVVVYAYLKGTFNKESETGDNNAVQFRNAINSAAVAEDGSFELHFLEEGEYELFFAGYEEDGDGQFQLQGSLSLDITGALNLGLVTINANSSSELNVLATGLIPL